VDRRSRPAAALAVLLAAAIAMTDLAPGATARADALPAPAGAPASLRIPSADGMSVRVGEWRPAGGPRGTVLLLHGRSEFLEKYAETAAEWTRRGYAVVGLDWRGQGLSDRYPDAGAAGHVPDYADYVADARALLDHAERTGAPRPWVLFAHSMGGHVALRLLAAGEDRVAAAVLSAPMTDIRTDPFPRWLAAAVVRTAAAAGLGARYAFGQGDYDPAGAAFEGNPVTSDRARWRAHHEGFARDPGLVVGGVTFGWLAATFRSVDALAAPGAPEGIRVPVLFAVAPDDALVPSASQLAIAARVPGAVVRTYPGSRHEPFMEADAVRDRVWADVDGFLDGLGLPSGR
jgi:lysophospholipase